MATTQAPVFKIFGKEHPKAPRVPSDSSQPSTYPPSGNAATLPSTPSTASTDRATKYPAPSQLLYLIQQPVKVEIQDTASQHPSPSQPAPSPSPLSYSEDDIQVPLSHIQSLDLPPASRASKRELPYSTVSLTSASTSPPHLYYPFFPPDSPPPPLSPTLSHSPRPYQSVSVLYQPLPSNTSKLSRSLPSLPPLPHRPISHPLPSIALPSQPPPTRDQPNKYPTQPPSRHSHQHISSHAQKETHFPKPQSTRLSKSKSQSPPSNIPPPASGTQLTLAIMQQQALDSIAQALDHLRTPKDDDNRQPFHYINSTTLSLPLKRVLDDPSPYNSDRTHKVPRVEHPTDDQRVPLTQSAPVSVSQSLLRQSTEIPRTKSQFSNPRDLPACPSNKPLRNISVLVPNEAAPSRPSASVPPTHHTEPAPSPSRIALANVLRNRLLASASSSDAPLPSNLSNSLTVTTRIPDSASVNDPASESRCTKSPESSHPLPTKEASDTSTEVGESERANQEPASQSPQWVTKWASTWAANKRAKPPQSQHDPPLQPESLSQPQPSPLPGVSQYANSHSTAQLPPVKPTAAPLESVQPQSQQKTASYELPSQTANARVSDDQLFHNFKWGEWVAIQRENSVQWKKCDHHRGAPNPMPPRREEQPHLGRSKSFSALPQPPTRTQRSLSHPVSQSVSLQQQAPPQPLSKSQPIGPPPQLPPNPLTQSQPLPNRHLPRPQIPPTHPQSNTLHHSQPPRKPQAPQQLQAQPQPQLEEQTQSSFLDFQLSPNHPLSRPTSQSPPQQAPPSPPLPPKPQQQQQQLPQLPRRRARPYSLLQANSQSNHSDQESEIDLNPMLPHPLLRAPACGVPFVHVDKTKNHTYANGSDKNNTRDFRRDFHRMLITQGDKMKKKWHEFHQSKHCTIARAPCIKVYREFCTQVGGAFEELHQTTNFSKLGTQTMCQCNSRLFLPYNG